MEREIKVTVNEDLKIEQEIEKKLMDWFVKLPYEKKLKVLDDLPLFFKKWQATL